MTQTIAMQRHRATALRTVGTLILALVAALTLATAFAQDSQEPTESDVPGLIERGDFAMGRGNCALAQFYYQEALKADDDNVAGLVGKGRSLSCQGAYDAATEAFREALALDAENVRAHVQLALNLNDQYQSDPTRFSAALDEALDLIDAAEQIAPTDPKVLNTKGLLLYRLGDIADARVAFERAVSEASGGSITPSERSTIQDNLGRAYRDLGELELARQAFRRAVVLDPTNPSPHNNLGNVLFRQGNCEDAEYELSQAVALAPGSLSPISQLSITLFECGRVDASVSRFEQAVALDNAILVPALFTYLSRAYLQQGRLDDAVRRAQQGALLSENDAEAYYWLGQAYVERGGADDAAAARRAFERALEIDPDYAEAQQALDRLP